MDVFWGTQCICCCRAEKEKLVLEDECLVSIAGRVGKSPAQVILRWLYQRRIASIPKSITPARIQQNIQVQHTLLAVLQSQSMVIYWWTIIGNVLCCVVYCSRNMKRYTVLSIPSLSTRIVPLRFQAGGHRRWPNLGLVCVLLCNLCYLYSLVKMDCRVLFYLV